MYIKKNWTPVFGLAEKELTLIQISEETGYCPVRRVSDLAQATSGMTILLIIPQQKVEIPHTEMLMWQTLQQPCLVIQLHCVSGMQLPDHSRTGAASLSPHRCTSLLAVRREPRFLHTILPLLPSPCSGQAVGGRLHNCAA